MGRLIDADMLDFTIQENQHPFTAVIVQVVKNDIDKCPTIDPIHYAGSCYCRECEWCLMDLSGREAHLCMKDVIRKRVKVTDFCSYGRRREGAE